MLAKGLPVTVEDIASVTGKPADEVRKVLAVLPDVEFNEQGCAVGFGLTLVLTPHHFKVAGKQLYAWCALDTLMFPELIGRMVEIESPCCGTGKPVRLTVEPGRVISVEPSASVVSIVTPETILSVRTDFVTKSTFSVHRVPLKAGLKNPRELMCCPLRMPFELAVFWGRDIMDLDMPTSCVVANAK